MVIYQAQVAFIQLKKLGENIKDRKGLGGGGN